MRRQKLAALAMVPVLAFGVTACGGKGGGTGGKSTAKAASDLDSMRKFAQCMRENGVDMPDPSADGHFQLKATGGKGGMDKMKAAETKCRHLMPNGGKPQKPKPEQLAMMRAMAKCMRQHGLTNFPDPNADGGIEIKGGKGTNMDPNSQAFKDADKACRKYQPGGGAGAQTNTGSGEGGGDQGGLSGGGTG
jgi:hypothetical protein